MHTAGLCKDGTVRAVGFNEYHECHTETWQNVISIGAGIFYTMALCQDGTVLTTMLDENDKPETAKWQKIKAIAAGGHHRVGLREDGTVVQREIINAASVILKNGRT